MASKTLGHNENKNLVDLDEWVQNKTSGSSEEIEEIKEAIRNMWSTIYPVGSIYISVSATNPGTIWGGTWVAWGTGRVPVGVSTGDAEFNTVEKVGGNKNLQAHTHRFYGEFVLKVLEGSSAHPNSIAHSNTPSTIQVSEPDWGGNIWKEYIKVAGEKWNKGSRITINGPTQSTGDGNAQNLQPYITCYMWKRVE